MICHRWAIRPATAVVSASAKGRIAGRVATANRAVIAASTGSVFARLPDTAGHAPGRRREPAPGRPPRPAARRRPGWPPPCSRARPWPPRHQRRCQRLQPLEQRIDAGRASAHRDRLAGHQRVHVQPGPGDVGPDGIHLHRKSSVPRRARLAAPATVRLRWNGGRGPTKPWGSRTGPVTPWLRWLPTATAAGPRPDDGGSKSQRWPPRRPRRDSATGGWWRRSGRRAAGEGETGQPDAGPTTMAATRTGRLAMPGQRPGTASGPSPRLPRRRRSRPGRACGAQYALGWLNPTRRVIRMILMSRASDQFSM